MATIGIHALHRCMECRRRAIPPCYPNVFCCSDCEAKYRAPFLAPLLRQRCGIEIDGEIAMMIAKFAANTWNRRRRLRHLHLVLRAHYSCFLQFTYFDLFAPPGRSSRISATEDILDRIMSFL